MTTPPHIQIIIGSIREGRVGEPVANWFAEIAADREDLSTELIDLREWKLPFLINATPPSRGYETDIQGQWAAKVGEADGYVLVTAEYNHGYALLDELTWWAVVLRAGRAGQEGQ
jgi:NAD(P)H-dependent FMN reductase